MKTKLILVVLFFIMFFAGCLCKKSAPPTIEITNYVPNGGWTFDTLSYNLFIKTSEPPVHLFVLPAKWSGYGDNIIDTFLLNNENYFTYNYVLAFDDYYEIEIKFEATQNDQQKDSIIRYVINYTMGPK